MSGESQTTQTITSEMLTKQAQARGWVRGTKLQYGEFPATVMRHYFEDMWEVRVPGGEICVGGSSLTPREG